MSDPTDDKPMGLTCLGGAEPSADLTLGLKDLLLLPQGAKQHLWEVLGPVLQYPLPEDLDAHLDAFRRKHEAPGPRFVRALGACRQLLTEAARHDVSRKLFAADLAQLSPKGGELAAILMPGFDRAMEGLKQEILYGTLLDHGKLLIGVDWRVDSMVASHRGQKLQSAVTQVTLRYREGKEERRITVQALPDMLRELQAMCRQILD